MGNKKIRLCFFITWILLLIGCSKDEALEHYNNIVEKLGEAQLTSDSKLQGKRVFGEDEYTGTYEAEYHKFSGTEYLFGGTSIEREAGNKIEVSCQLEIMDGKAEVFFLSGSDEPVVLIEATDSFDDTITLPDGGNYIGITGEKFKGTVKLEIK